MATLEVIGALLRRMVPARLSRLRGGRSNLTNRKEHAMNSLIKVAALAALSCSTTAFAAESSDYSKLDTNGDGKISKDEAKADPEMAAKFDELDTNKDGSLTSSEIQAGAKRRRDK